MIGQRAQGRAGIALTLLIIASVWVLSGLRAYGAYSDAHNPSFAHVHTSLSRCGGNGCEATFSFRGRAYTVTGLAGRDGQRVTLYVKPSDPYVYAQSQSWLQAYGPFIVVVLLTVLGGGAWWFRRRRAAHTGPAASRS